MKTTIQLAIVSILLLTACKKNGSGVTQSLEPRYSSSTNNARSNSNAQQGIELMYYDSMLVQMKLNQFAIRPSRSFLVHSQPLNSLYMANGYATVIDAIQGESYRAIWREVDIVFNTKLKHQFYSDAEILAAAAGPSPEITLVFTNKIYQGAIIEHIKVQ